MKNIYLIILMILGICTFTACSKDDHESGPVKIPVTDVKIPSTIKPGEVLVIEGKGFTEQSQIFLQSVNPLKMEKKSVDNTGVTIDIPDDLATGVYFVLLQQESIWELGRVHVVTGLPSPVTETVVPEEATAGDLITIEGTGFSSDCRISIVGSTAEEIMEITGRTDHTLTVRLPVMLKTGEYTLLLRQGEQWELGTIRIHAKTTSARFAKIIHVREESDGMRSVDTTLFMYREGRLESLILGTEYSRSKYAFEYEEGLITVNNYFFNIYDPDPETGDEGGYWEWSDSYTFTVADDLIINHEVYGEPYDWNYDSDNHLTSVSNGSTSTVTYHYLDEKLESMQQDEWGSETTYRFSYADQPNDKAGVGVDAMAVILYLLNNSTNELHARLLNLCGKASAVLPSEIIVKGEYVEATYRFSYKTINGYVSKITKSGTDAVKDIYDISYE